MQQPIIINSFTLTINPRLSSFLPDKLTPSYFRKKIGVEVIIFTKGIYVELDVLFNKVCAKIIGNPNKDLLIYIVNNIVGHIIKRLRKESNGKHTFANSTKTCLYVYTKSNESLSIIDFSYERSTFTTINDEPLGELYNEHSKLIVVDNNWIVQRVNPPGITLYSHWKSSPFDILHNSLYVNAGILGKSLIKPNKSI